MEGGAADVAEGEVCCEGVFSGGQADVGEEVAESVHCVFGFAGGAAVIAQSSDGVVGEFDADVVGMGGGFAPWADAWEKVDVVAGLCVQLSEYFYRPVRQWDGKGVFGLHVGGGDVP